MNKYLVWEQDNVVLNNAHEEVELVFDLNKITSNKFATFFADTVNILIIESNSQEEFTNNTTDFVNSILIDSAKKANLIILKLLKK